MKRALLMSVLLGALLFTGVVVAQPDPLRVQDDVYGFGNASCRSWLTERKQQRVGGAHQAWVLGFVQGLRYAGFRLRSGTDSLGLLAFVDSYCAEHPLDNISKATVALVENVQAKTP